MNTLLSCFKADLWFWSSASDIGRQPGQFHWSNGTPLNKSIWGAVKLNAFGAGKQSCVSVDSMIAKVATLSDYPCTEVSNVMCELPPGLLFCFGIK